MSWQNQNITDPKVNEKYLNFIAEQQEAGNLPANYSEMVYERGYLYPDGKLVTTGLYVEDWRIKEGATRLWMGTCLPCQFTKNDGFSVAEVDGEMKIVQTITYDSVY